MTLVAYKNHHPAASADNQSTTNYKHTEIGLLPFDWEVRPIRELVHRVRLGGNYPNSEQQTPYPLMKMGNMGRGSIVLDKIEYIPTGYPVEAHHRLRFGDVLFNTRNTLDLVGKVCIWRDELPKAY
jgi:type I restriction enzyme S subunit